jgi:hypothetical protein
VEWEGDEEEEGEEGERAAWVEEACAWGGSVIGELGSCAAVSDDMEVDDKEEKIEMIVDSGCRRTIVKPGAFKGMKVKKTDNVGKNFRTANGAHIPNQGETTIEGRDATGAKLKVVAQVADVTKNLASVMEMVDRGNWVIFHKEGGYIQTMKKEEELKMRTLMNTLKGARVPIARKGNNFVVEIKVDQKNAEEKDKDGYIVPKKVAAKRWSSMKKMDVDEGKLTTKNKYGALSLEDEEAYEQMYDCRPCGGHASVFAGQGWGM